MKALLLISHGSRLHETKQEIISLTQKLKNQTRISIVEYAFLEIEKPTIAQGIDRCVHKGAQEIIILLNFLNAGRHVNKDIPLIVQQAQKRYPAVRFYVSSPVGQHPQIIDLFVHMIHQYSSTP